MFAADVFDSKFINDKAKSDGMCFVLPEEGHIFDGMVSKRCQILDEFVV